MPIKFYHNSISIIYHVFSDVHVLFLFLIFHVFNLRHVFIQTKMLYLVETATEDEYGVPLIKSTKCDPLLVLTLAVDKE